MNEHFWRGFEKEASIKDKIIGWATKGRGILNKARDTYKTVRDYATRGKGFKNNVGNVWDTVKNVGRTIKNIGGIAGNVANLSESGEKFMTSAKGLADTANQKLKGVTGKRVAKTLGGAGLLYAGGKAMSMPADYQKYKYYKAKNQEHPLQKEGSAKDIGEWIKNKLSADPVGFATAGAKHISKVLSSAAGGIKKVVGGADKASSIGKKVSDAANKGLKQITAKRVGYGVLGVGGLYGGGKLLGVPANYQKYKYYKGMREREGLTNKGGQE
jgi:hypothetical protein